MSTHAMQKLAMDYRGAFANVKQDQLHGTTRNMGALGAVEIMSPTEITRIHDEITAQMAE